jgi:hypothetical protein
MPPQFLCEIVTDNLDLSFCDPQPAPIYTFNRVRRKPLISSFHPDLLSPRFCCFRSASNFPQRRTCAECKLPLRQQLRWIWSGNETPPLVRCRWSNLMSKRSQRRRLLGTHCMSSRPGQAAGASGRAGVRSRASPGCPHGRVAPGNFTPRTGSPGAVTRPRLPQIVACSFPALRSSDGASQRRRCYSFESCSHGWRFFSLHRRPNSPVVWSPCFPRTTHLPLAASPCSRLSRPPSTISQSDCRQVVRSPSPCQLVGPYKSSLNLTALPCSHGILRLHASGTNPGSISGHSPCRILGFCLPR